jgi:dTDP-4-dehydrorhamnose reductase
MRVMVLGATGQVGSALVGLLGERAVPVGRADLDLATTDDLAGRLSALAAARPVDAVINAAAFTAVDRAESEEALAHRINGDAPAAIARWAADRALPLVHYSSDYVFPGSGTAPWREDDPTAPLNAYGRSKLAGEVAVASAGGRHLVLRTQWVYDDHHANFLTAILRAARRDGELRVVADQFGAPTPALVVARATLAILGQAVARAAFPTGTYHLCCTGETSWHGFAVEILRLAQLELPVRAIATEEHAAAATRPRNGRLDRRRLEDTFDVRLPPWQAGLRELMGCP